MARPEKIRLGDLLIQDKLISQEQLRFANGLRGLALVAAGTVSLAGVAALMFAVFGIPSAPARATQLPASRSAVSGMPERPVGAGGAPLDSAENFMSGLKLASEMASMPVRPQHEAGKGVAAKRVAVPGGDGGESPAIKRVGPGQLAASEFSEAMLLVQQGRNREAQQRLEEALRLDPEHGEARQALVGLLLEDKRTEEAERAAREWLHHEPARIDVAMLLARLQLERGAQAPALETLQQAAPYAGERGDYHAFMAAILQRQNRHDEAVTHYQIALQQSPNSGAWLMGLGISLQALKRNEEARIAYQRAIDTQGLSDELRAYVELRMKEL